MKWAIIASAVALAAASGFTREDYASGEVMELMMKGKEVKKNSRSGDLRRD